MSITPLIVRTAVAWLLVLACWPAQAEKFNVVYSREIADTDSRLEYPVRLLELALKKSAADFTIQPYHRPMPQGAALSRLASGQGVNVVWSMTSKEREEHLLPIRIPVDKGLFGYRVPLVREQNRTHLASVQTVQDLRNFAAGQGHDWPDRDILQGNGLRVVTSTAAEGLFPMLQAGRFDYFPRSVLELVDEAEHMSKYQIAPDERLLLYYPAAIYFFVNKKDAALARVIEAGLNRALADGSFDALFFERFGDVIKRANMRGRTLIALNNPLLPPETPLTRKGLWLDVNNLPR
jgi:hypothetical protein